MAATSNGSGATPPQPAQGLPWDLLIQIIGAGAGLGAWISVVGGARIWAGFHAAHVSASPSVALQSRQYLFIEGLRWLLLPLLIGAAVAAIVYFSYKPSPSLSEDFESGFQKWRISPQAREATIEWWAMDPSARHGTSEDYLRQRFAQRLRDGEKTPASPAFRAQAARPFRFVWSDGLAQLILTAAVAVSIWLLVEIEARYALMMMGLTIAGLAFAFWVLPRSRTRKARAAGFFVAVVLWSGALGFLFVLGQRHPKLDLALVARKAPHILAVGFYVARSDGDIYVAEKNPAGIRVVMVPKADVECFSYGPKHEVRNGDTRAALLKLFPSVGDGTCPTRR